MFVFLPDERAEVTYGAYRAPLRAHCETEGYQKALIGVKGCTI
jgi:hypothetical protein